MIAKKLKKKPPINTLVIACYFLLIMYAYIRTDRIINNIVVLMTLMILIDGIYFFVMIPRIKIELKVDHMVEKNDSFHLQISLKNHAPLPVAYTYLIPKEGKKSTLKETNSIGTMLQGNEYVSHMILYNANLSGLEEVGLEKIIYKSFFSFFKKEVEIREGVKVKILPNVIPLREMKGFTEFINKIAPQSSKQVEASITMEGEEEVGYDLRPYLVGDSQRLIHWKIAAYKGELLVRQREKNNDRRKELFFILNPFLSVQEDERLIVQDKVLTTFVSLVGYYLNQGEKVRIAYYQSKIWQYTKIQDSFELKQLQEVLGAYDFLNVEETISQRSILKSIIHIAKKKAGIKVIVSNYWTHEMEEYILNRKQIKIMPYIWTGSQMPSTLPQESHIPMWHMTDEYIMRLPLRKSFDIEENTIQEET